MEPLAWRKQCILDAGNWESDTHGRLGFELSRSVKTGNSNILKMWLPLLNYQPL
jgi:hypothetical protein